MRWELRQQFVSHSERKWTWKPLSRDLTNFLSAQVNGHVWLHCLACIDLQGLGIGALSSSDDEVGHCRVSQILGRDYTDPVFSLEVAVEDDKSDVIMTLCVGTYPAGCDVVKDEPLKAYSTCSLQNYDTTPPSGRLTSQFSTTSHPHVLRASLVATNDSELTVQKVSHYKIYTNIKQICASWTSFL